MGARGWRCVAAMVGVGALTLAACGKDSNTTSAGTSTTSTTEGSTTTGVTSPSSTTTSTTTPAADDLHLSAEAYGPLTIGMTIAQATATGLIKGDFGPGCELAGPGQKVGTLQAPLDGTVTSQDGKVQGVFVRSHFVTSPGGIRVGDPLAKVMAAFPAPYAVAVDKSREDSFLAWFVQITKADAPEFELMVDPATQKVTAAGIPYVPVCD